MAGRRKDFTSTTLRVTRAGYEPSSAYDQEIHSRYAVGSIVEADLHQRKSNELLRLYWGFMTFVVEGTGRFGNGRALSNALLIEGGYVEKIQLFGGGVNVQPQSIGDMDDATFKRFAELAFGTIWEEFSIDVEDYKRHLRQRGFRDGRKS